MRVAFAIYAKATHIFPAKILMYMPYLMIKVLQSFNDMLINDIASFKQLGQGPFYDKGGVSHKMVAPCRYKIKVNIISPQIRKLMEGACPL